MSIQKICCILLALLAILATDSICRASASEIKIGEPSQIIFYGKGRVSQPDQQSYALIRKQGTSYIISANGEQVPVDELKRLAHGDIVWFRDGDATSVIADPIFLARAEKAWLPYQISNDAVAISRHALRTQEKMLSELQSEQAQQLAPTSGRRAGAENFSSRIQNQKSLMTEQARTVELSEQRRSAAYQAAQVAMRQLIDEATRRGRIFPFSAGPAIPTAKGPE